MAVFSFLHPGHCTYMYMLRVRLYYDTCTPLHRPECTYTSATRMSTLCMPTRWVPTVRHFLACEDVAGGSQQSGGRIVLFFCPDALPCVRRCSWWILAVRGQTFFHQIWWPVRWVPALKWRNNYFAHNKEALPCCGHGPSCQPLHIQSTSDGSHSLTMLTTPRREH